MSEHDRAEVARLVLVGEVVLGDARLRVVLDLAQVFSVGRVLPLARDPHHVAGLVAADLVLFLDVLDQPLGRVLRQVVALLVGLGRPIVDLKGCWLANSFEFGEC